MLEHRRAAAVRPAAPLVRAPGQRGACHLQSPEQDATDSTMAAALRQAAQTASAPAATKVSDLLKVESTQRGATSASASTSMRDTGVRGGRKIHKEPKAAAAPAGVHSRGLLERCVESSAPLPEADVESLARQAGLAWVERRGPLLTRTFIAQAPEVSASQQLPALCC